MEIHNTLMYSYIIISRLFSLIFSLIYHLKNLIRYFNVYNKILK